MALEDLTPGQRALIPGTDEWYELRAGRRPAGNDQGPSERERGEARGTTPGTNSPPSRGGQENINRSTTPRETKTTETTTETRGDTTTQTKTETTESEEQEEKKEETKTEEEEGSDWEQTMFIRGGGTWMYEAGGGPQGKNRYFVRYKLPQQGKYVVFEASQQDLDNMFEDGVPPDARRVNSNYINSQRNKGNFTYGGFVDEMIDPNEEEFSDFLTRVIDDALAEFPFLDQNMKNDPVIQTAVFRYVELDLDTDDFILSLAGHQAFQDKYQKFGEVMDRYDWTPSQTVQYYQDYSNAASQVFAHYGEEPPDNAQIGELINSGRSIEIVEQMMGNIWDFRQNQGLLEAYVEQLTARDPDLAARVNYLRTEEDVMALLTGANQELLDDFQRGQVQHSFNIHGLDQYYTADEVADLWGRLQGTELADNNLAIPLRNAARSILGLRHQIDWSRYDIDEDDIINLSVGLPSKTKTPQEIAERVQRIAQEVGAEREDRGEPFYQFDDYGVPRAISLRKLSDEIQPSRRNRV